MNKTFFVMGYNNLATILEQERRHWLMKTDKQKQIQESLTGDMYEGIIDNKAADITIETKKLPYKYDTSKSIKFGIANADKVFGIYNSTFPYSNGTNGLLFLRVLSSNFPYPSDEVLVYNKFKLIINNATRCSLLFGNDLNTNEIYADTWIKSSIPPTILIYDNNTHDYTISRTLTFNDDVEDVVYYYPLSEELRPFDITYIGNDQYEIASPSDNDIGYPMIWFTCNKSNIGSTLTFTNNTNTRNEQIFFVSNAGNATRYNGMVFTGIDGNNNATPAGDSTNKYIITCESNSTSFTGNFDYDKTIPIKHEVKLINKETLTEYTIDFICNENDKITMGDNNIPWIYNNNKYSVDMDYFDQNCIYDEHTKSLVNIFNIHFDENVPFVKSTSDVGMVGIKMISSNTVSDVHEKFPYNLNKWSGLPEWINDLNDNNVSENLVMYAFHQPPSYDPEQPETLQGAGIILDPGKPMVDEYGFGNENIGRAYLLSNDDLEYKNNKTETFPKPARTIARICDIPTSVMQLSGVSGLAPDPIVDKKYVRTEANFSNEALNKLYNELPSLFVRPTALTKNGNPVHEELGFNNRLAFETFDTLLAVDMLNHNDFRIIENLNPMVDVSKIHIRDITNPGSGYKVNDQGVCVVGGYAFTYIITEATEIDVDTNTGGNVISADLVPTDIPYINLANFDMDNGTAGISDPYGTSPTSGNGKGLKISFRIEYDYYQSILPTKGEYRNGLFAFVRERDGMYVYDFIIDNTSTAFPKPGKWRKGVKLSEYEVTSIYKDKGGVSTQESYLNSIIPSVRDLPITLKNNNEDNVTISLIQTSSFINIIDKEFSPIVPTRESDDIIDENIVDICKFKCDGFITEFALSRTVESVKQRLKELNVLRYNSYVLWRWEETSGTKFTYGIVYRGFNNLMSTDTITMLPTNNLKCDNYVDTNPSTTIVWNNNIVGPMMWIFDPSYNKKESYYINQETMELHVVRDDMTYDMIDVHKDIDGNIEPITRNGRYLFNVMTNNPVVNTTTESYPIYQQPDFIELDDVKVNSFTNNTIQNHLPIGNWRLVFPRVNSYTLKDDATNTKWIPIKMQVIKGRNINDIGTVYDENGNDVSMKSLIINETESGVSLQIWNSTTNEWVKI